MYELQRKAPSESHFRGPRFQNFLGEDSPTSARFSTSVNKTTGSAHAVGLGLGITSPTSFPGLQCEDEGRDEEALVWAGHVSTQKMAVFDSYSSRSGEIFFNEIYKSSKQINSQKTSQSILFMCRAKFGTNQLKSMKNLDFQLYRQSCIQAASRRLHASGDSHEICFLLSWTIWLLL
jgi:hypothetical protein